MKIQGWVVVYPYADINNRTGYWFNSVPPSSNVDGKVYAFALEVPDPVDQVPATLIPDPADSV